MDRWKHEQKQAKQFARQVGGRFLVEVPAETVYFLKLYAKLSGVEETWQGAAQRILSQKASARARKWVVKNVQSSF